MSLHTLELSALRARQFAKQAASRLQPWMHWDGWVLFVGCDVCLDDGVDAECWGREGCHGYTNGCGCTDCAHQQAIDAAASGMAA